MWSERQWIRPGKERQAPAARRDTARWAGGRRMTTRQVRQRTQAAGTGRVPSPFPSRTAPALVLPASSVHYSGPTLGAGEDSRESLGLQGDPTSPS